MRRGKWRTTNHALDGAVGLAMLVGCLARYAIGRRRVLSLDERLAMLPRRGLPLEKPVAIRWNCHHVPFIEAQADEDLAVALGIVHAHLRLGQLELMRRLAQGRLAELIGSSGVALDQLLRTLDVGRAAPAILAGMPPETRAWLEAFVRGLNHHLMHVRPLPLEFDLFDLQPEPWGAADVIALGRLVSADVNWIVWFQLLKFRGDPDWPKLWRRLLAVDSLSCWTNQEDNAGVGLALRAVLAAPLRFGSNSFVAAPFRSATDGAIIASDPHLSIILPNCWLLAGVRSPSYHAAGLMIPGLPFVALGRNPWIAWGGTSLHAASSDLFVVAAEDVSRLAEREVELVVRWGRNRKIRIREAQWGPVVTDIPLLAAGREPLALCWVGHRPTDEITAMLAVARARNWPEFRAALVGFAVPGQNMTYADTSGHVGRLMAVHLPHRHGVLSDDVAMQPGSDAGWDTPLTCEQLPFLVDPPEGFITSANERPPEGSAFIGQHFSPPDRKQRLDHLLAQADPISVTTAAQIQQDAHWQTALAQRRQLLAWLGSSRLGRLNDRQRRFVDEIARWDGSYASTSRGALAFEVLCCYLVRRLVPTRRRAIYGAAWGTRRLIWDDVLAADPRQRERALGQALRRAAHAIGGCETWGGRHRLRLGHPLAILPIIGRAWRFTDEPTGGTSDSVMKTAHALTDKRHAPHYGSVARHISDLSDLDRNYFVLLGGQDGWLGSTTFLDQVSLWTRGEYISLPLRPETASATFPFCTELLP